MSAVSTSSLVVKMYQCSGCDSKLSLINIPGNRILKFVGKIFFLNAVYLLKLEHVLGFHFLPDESQKSREKNDTFIFI
jgi:hypothetical protein